MDISFLMSPGSMLFAAVELTDIVDSSSCSKPSLFLVSLSYSLLSAINSVISSCKLALGKGFFGCEGGFTGL